MKEKHAAAAHGGCLPRGQDKIQDNTLTLRLPPSPLSFINASLCCSVDIGGAEVDRSKICPNKTCWSWLLFPLSSSCQGLLIVVLLIIYKLTVVSLLFLLLYSMVLYTNRHLKAAPRSWSSTEKHPGDVIGGELGLNIVACLLLQPQDSVKAKGKHKASKQHKQQRRQDLVFLHLPQIGTPSATQYYQLHQILHHSDVGRIEVPPNHKFGNWNFFLLAVAT